MNGSMQQQSGYEREFGGYMVDHRDGSSELFVTFDRDPVRLENVGVTLRFLGSYSPCGDLSAPPEDYYVRNWRSHLALAEKERKQGRLLVVCFLPDQPGVRTLVRKAWEKLTNELGTYIPCVFVNSRVPKQAL